MLLSRKVEKCGFLHDIFKEVNNDLNELKKTFTRLYKLISDFYLIIHKTGTFQGIVLQELSYFLPLRNVKGSVC